MIEHTLYWERHSIDDLARTQLRGRTPDPVRLAGAGGDGPDLWPAGGGARQRDHPGDRAAGRGRGGGLKWKLWIYTNYDCNLRCSYCVAKSGPNVARRALGWRMCGGWWTRRWTVCFDHVFFTGGEPFLLNDIYDMLAYSSARVKTTVLTNAMLLKQKLPGGQETRLERLSEVANDNLIIQVSLDGGRAEDTRCLSRRGHLGQDGGGHSSSCRRRVSGCGWARPKRRSTRAPGRAVRISPLAGHPG